ncbi:MAG: NAD-binding protein [Anaerolineae bacterium]|nr:NAD-binding protein [Anaerolineae bacterium]MCB0226568.1 NAD-binding protein [Anaerolineae bacterium]MCB9103724.1 NAD-binding protein [Anaerolineales bacterium]
MVRIKSQFWEVWAFVERENLHRILVIIILLVLGSSIGLVLVEPGVGLLDAMWWSIVTLTTVGYGDIYPQTIGGRFIALVIMFGGIGVLAAFSATMASILVDRKLKEDRGMNTFKLKGHIILCEWNYKARNVVEELRADPQTATTPVVLIANIEQKPLKDENLFFIQGNVNDETLERANLAQADTVVILGDEKIDASTRDAKVILTTLTIESLNPKAYTIAELIDRENIRHCKRANVDEVVVASELGSSLIAQTTLDHGLASIISEILRTNDGSELYRVPVPPSLIGKTFKEAFITIKENHNGIVLAVYKDSQKRAIVNPSMDYVFETTDHLIIVTPERPHLS